MSSLSSQLNKISSSNLFKLKARKSVVSILFDEKKAAFLDDNEIFDISFNGYLELCGISAKFQKYEKVLFSESSRSLDIISMVSLAIM